MSCDVDELGGLAGIEGAKTSSAPRAFPRLYSPHSDGDLCGAKEGDRDPTSAAADGGAGVGGGKEGTEEKKAPMKLKLSDEDLMELGYGPDPANSFFDEISTAAGTKDTGAQVGEKTAASASLVDHDRPDTSQDEALARRLQSAEENPRLFPMEEQDNFRENVMEIEDIDDDFKPVQKSSTGVSPAPDEGVLEPEDMDVLRMDHQKIQPDEDDYISDISEDDMVEGLELIGRLLEDAERAGEEENPDNDDEAFRDIEDELFSDDFEDMKLAHPDKAQWLQLCKERVDYSARKFGEFKKKRHERRVKKGLSPKSSEDEMWGTHWQERQDLEREWLLDSSEEERELEKDMEEMMADVPDYVEGTAT